MNGTVSTGARPGPMPVHRPDAFSSGCGRKDCFRGAAAPDCELHGNLVRDIIRSRREERRTRLQQRCRTLGGGGGSDTIAMTAAAAAASASRNVTPLRRQLSQSSSIKSDSPRSVASAEFPSCVSPLMEGLMLEITDAIQSSGTRPEIISPQGARSTFDMDDIFRLIEEAQREYESLGEPHSAQMRHEAAQETQWSREDCWESILGHL